MPTIRLGCDHMCGMSFDQEGFGGTCQHCGEYFHMHELEAMMLALRREQIEWANTQSPPKGDEG